MRQGPPPPAAMGPQAAAPAPGRTGQWVYTQQYGWVYMPYGQAYTYVPPSDNGYPYMYLYYPRYGWTWVAAPWVWGWGPRPHFGACTGYRYYHWYPYRRPWFYRPGYGVHYGHFRRF